jgi:hypothetical protein
VRKGFAPPVVMRWASALRGGGMMTDLKLLLVNENANINFWEIWEHPELQYKLLASCGTKSGQRNEWIAMPGKQQSSSEVHDFLSKYWPDANEDELKLLLKQFTRETYHEFVERCGLAPAETDAAIQAYDKLMGYKTSGSKKKAKPKG